MGTADWFLARGKNLETSETNRVKIDLTPWVSGRYGYLLKIALNGTRRQAWLRDLKITTWVQVAPASLPALQPGLNRMRLVTGDHYGLPSRVREVRSRASHPHKLLKYLASGPADYAPDRKTERLRGTIVAQVDAPPNTQIAWFTATGQFKTYQQERAVHTQNEMAYAANKPKDFISLYQADVPTYTNHWHYNAAREVQLEEPAKRIFVRYTGNPALNNFAIYAHCIPDRAPVQPSLEITHKWTEQGRPKQARIMLERSGAYEVKTTGNPVNQSIELAVKSQRLPPDPS